MAKRENDPKTPATNYLEYLHQPHDKFMKKVLGLRQVAMEWIEFALPPADFAQLDLATFQLERTVFWTKK